MFETVAFHLPQTIDIPVNAFLIAGALLGYCALAPVCFLLCYAGAYGDQPEGTIGTVIFFFMFSLPSTVLTIALGWDLGAWFMGWGLFLAAVIILFVLMAIVTSAQEHFKEPYAGPDHFRVRTEKDLNEGTLDTWLKEYPEQAKGYQGKQDEA